MLKRVLVGVAAVVMLAGAAMAGPVEDAEAAYDRGDFVTARTLLRPLADQGNAQAQMLLGYIYDNGKDVEPDHAEAIKWYRKAAEQGEANAQYHLGAIYHYGQGVAKDRVRAAKWFQKAAKQGQVYAQYEVGRLFQYGIGVPENLSYAIIWFKRAAEQGLAEAQYSLGIFYMPATVPDTPHEHANITEAAKWFLLAAEQSHAEAQIKIGEMHADGLGVLQDTAAAVNWFKLAAEQGHAKGMYGLALSYLNPEIKGIPKDKVQGHMWLNLAASYGDRSAGRDRDGFAENMTAESILRAQILARNWRPKDGGKQKTNKDAVALRIDAERGDDVAQWKLGEMYRSGRDFLQDFQEAMTWYTRAANHGNAAAQYALGSIYTEATGVPQNYVAGHMWLNLAAAGGHHLAFKARNDLTELMTSDQVAEAQRLAREWKPEPEQ